MVSLVSCFVGFSQEKGDAEKKVKKDQNGPAPVVDSKMKDEVNMYKKKSAEQEKKLVS